MRLLCAGFLWAALCCGPAAAQAVESEKAEVRGQVFLPSGDPAQLVMRVQLSGEDGQRPPEYFFTDSKGRFAVRDLKQGGRYILVVESDGKNWATTTETIFITAQAQAFITLRLRPLLASPLPEWSIVSATELNRKVPPAAQRECEMGVAQLTAGDLARARKHFERAITLFPNYVEARSELAVVFMRQDALANAEALLQRAVEIDPAAARPLLNLGLCLYRQRRFAEALPLLERGVQLMPASANGNLLYGVTLVAVGNDTLAEPVLRKAYEQGGKSCAKAQLFLSQLLARQKKYDLAAEALDIYLRDVPGDPDAESLRATLFKLRAAARP